MNTPIFKSGAIAAAVLTVASLAGAQQASQPEPQPQNFDQPLRELNIMANIFAATLREDAGNDRRNFGPTPRSLYLAGQGMVFTFDINNPWFAGNWSSYLRQFGADISRLAGEIATEVRTSFPEVDFDFGFNGVPPVPPPPPAPDGAVVFRGPGSFGNPADWMDAQREQQEAMQEMAEAMRDRQRDIQDLQRDLRELQRDLRDPDEDSARIEEEIAQLEAAIADERSALERQRAAYEQFVAEYQTRRVEQITAYSQQLADRAIGALCDYGATLRSLPADEHVTLIFENFIDDRDQVYVFDAADVSACNSAESLRDRAVSYRM